MLDRLFSLDLLARYFFSAFGFLSVWLVAFLLDVTQSDQIFLLIYYATFFTGWCSLSFRQKLHSSFVSSSSDQYGSGSIYFIVFYIAGVFLSIFLANYISAAIGQLVDELFLFFIVLAFSLNAIVYSYLWSKRKLYISYFSDSIHYISLMVSVVIFLIFDINILLVWSILLIFITFLNIYLSRVAKNIHKIKLDKDLLFASIYSQLIAVISHVEIFLIDSVGLTTEYRLLMSVIMVFCLTVSVYRQRRISNKIYSIKFKWVGVLFFISTFFLFFSHIAGNLYIYYASLLVLVLSQSLISFNSYLFIVNQKVWVLVLVYVLSLVLILILISGSLKLYSMESLIALKLKIVYLTTLVFYIFTYYFSKKYMFYN